MNKDNDKTEGKYVDLFTFLRETNKVGYVDDSLKTEFKDTLNYQGVSLLSTKKLLCKYVSNYLLGLEDSYDTAWQYFKLLSTFRYSDVVSVMDDCLRADLRRMFKLTYLPYTMAHLNAINNVFNIYPNKSTVKLVSSNIDKLYKCFNDLESVISTDDKLTVKHYLDKIVDTLFSIPGEYRWLVKQLLSSSIPLLDKCKYYYSLDTKEIYNIYELISDDYTFSQQFTDDVTQLLSYKYPHPELIFALENIKHILDTCYSREQIVKLFIYDVYRRIELKLSEGYDRLPKELIDWFYRLNPDVIEEPVYTVDELHLLFKTSIDNYKRLGTGKADVLKYYTLFRSKTVEEVLHLHCLPLLFAEAENIIKD